MTTLSYRQVIVLLLGTAITITSFSFVYRWHNQFVAYTAPERLAPNAALTTVQPTKGNAIEHLAISYCANRIEQMSAAPIDDITPDGTAAGDAVQLTFYAAGQQLTVGEVLDDIALNDRQFSLRAYRANQFELEVSHGRR